MPLLEQLDKAVDLAAAASNDVHQLLLREMHRTGRGNQYPIALQQPQTELVQPGIGLFTRLLVPAPGNQRRRIQNHDIKLLLLIRQRLQGLEGIPLNGFHIVEAIEPGVVVNRINGTGRTVDTGHLGGPGTSGLNAPATDITEYIQHPLARRIGLQTGTVHPMIVKPARLLAAFQRHLEPDTVLLHLQQTHRSAMGLLHVGIQPLHLAHLAIVLEDDRLRVHQPLDCPNNCLLHRFHTGRGNLHHHRGIKPVNHQPRKPVTVAKHPTVKRLVEKPFSERKRSLHPLGQPLGRHTMARIPTDQPATNQRMGINEHCTQRLVVRRPKLRLNTGLEFRQRTAAGVHLIAVNP